MSFLIDTDVCSAYLKRPGNLFSRFVQYAGRMHLASVSLAELYVWAYGRDDPAPRLRQIADLTQSIEVVNFDAPAADHFGRLRARLKGHGVNVAAPDLMIASIALSRNLTLVTHNTRHFTPIAGLRLDDWLVP